MNGAVPVLEGGHSLRMGIYQLNYPQDSNEGSKKYKKGYDKIRGESNVDQALGRLNLKG